jgi:hypothetical protein
VLSNAIRWEIVCYVAAADEVTMTDLESEFDLARPTLAYHLRLLASTGILVRQRAARRSSYRLDGDALLGAIEDLQPLADQRFAGSGNARTAS